MIIRFTIIRALVNFNIIINFKIMRKRITFKIIRLIIISVTTHNRNPKLAYIVSRQSYRDALGRT